MYTYIYICVISHYPINPHTTIHTTLLSYQPTHPTHTHAPPPLRPPGRVAHHIHTDGVYESELERIGNVYMLRDEPPHRLYTLTAEAIMATGVYGFG